VEEKRMGRRNEHEGAGAGCQYVVRFYEQERKEAWRCIIDNRKLLGYGTESHGHD